MELDTSDLVVSNQNRERTTLLSTQLLEVETPTILERVQVQVKILQRSLR